MRRLNIIIGLIVLHVLLSCNQNKYENSNKLVLLNSYRHDSIWKTDSLYLTKSYVNDTLGFFYKQGKDTLGYSFFKLDNSDSSIFIYGLNCPFVSTRTFNIKNKDFTVLKYYYDEEHSADEESSFFYHKEYGILVCFNNGWSDLIFSMEHDNKSKILIDSIINDRTGFYRMNIPPPPPFSDSLIIEID